MRRTWLTGFAVVASASAVTLAGCTSRESAPASEEPPAASVVTPPSGLNLQPVTLPDLVQMEAPAREQLRARYAVLQGRVAHSGTSRADLADAYGELGKLLMAATQFDPAEACYLNAEALAPHDRRWPYYLAHLYKMKGPLEKSVAAFERALAASPADIATLVWLGDAYLAQGRADAAEPLFAKALAAEPRSAAARFGAGRAALARKDHPGAVDQLQQALALEPRATAIHYPLAMAYRGLGDVERAQAHLAKQGDIEARPVDPLMRELDELLQTPEAFNVRGGRALDAGNWHAAADYFRRGLELRPDDTSLRHRLGTALFQMGDARGAMEQFERVLRTSPDHARAHFSLGVLLNADGRYAEAAERLSSALQYEPGYVQARVQLAGVLARSGRPGEALEQYERALQADPTLSEAAFGRAMALIRLRRYQDAREALTAGMNAHADQTTFPLALARLLAAAPDDRVRNGAEAKRLVDELYRKQQSLELAETVAMTLAEIGQFEQAAGVQRDVLRAAEQAAPPHIVRRLRGNLALYESRQPCRTPFTEEELP
jgi:tetratricopeptide (TPR) repeat protein